MEGTMSDAKSKPYDIFRMDPNGVLWLEAATSIDDAKTRAQQLATHSPGEYLLMDQISGSKHVVKADGTLVPHQEQAEAPALGAQGGDYR
jgi:hypothetical protein